MNPIKAPTNIPKAAVPFISGLVAGALMITVFGFANDWVVTKNARDVAVSDASTNAQAAVCASLVETHLTATKSAISLDGYQAAARKARNDLARTFAVALPGEKTADSVVVNACAWMLNKTKT